MMTNKTIDTNSELYQKGQALMEAAHEYWKQYQKDVGHAAVVWIDNENDHFVLFTRGEYKDAIMSVAHREYAGQTRLFKPFESHRST